MGDRLEPGGLLTSAQGMTAEQGKLMQSMAEMGAHIFQVQGEANAGFVRNSAETHKIHEYFAAEARNPPTCCLYPESRTLLCVFFLFSFLGQRMCVLCGREREKIKNKPTTEP